MGERGACELHERLEEGEEGKRGGGEGVEDAVAVCDLDRREVVSSLKGVERGREEERPRDALEGKERV